MRKLSRAEDAFGAVLWDGLRGRRGEHVLERDDGRVEVMEAGGYFTAPSKWAPLVRNALRAMRGRVLDIGCGAGRHALFLQQRGCEVLAIDNSPLAIRTAKQRALRTARVLDIRDVGRLRGRFDHVVMLGNNFGLFGSRAGAKRLLKVLHRLTLPTGQLLVQSTDVYQTKNRDHLAYHRRNRARGRMAGQIRLRVRYENLATPWFDYLMVSQQEMREIAAGTGWRVARIMQKKGPSGYLAVLQKE